MATIKKLNPDAVAPVAKKAVPGKLPAGIRAGGKVLPGTVKQSTAKLSAIKTPVGGVSPKGKGVGGVGGTLGTRVLNPETAAGNARLAKAASKVSSAATARKLAANKAAGVGTVASNPAYANRISGTKTSYTNSDRNPFDQMTATTAADLLQGLTGVRIGRNGIKSVDPLALGLTFLPEIKGLGMLGRAVKAATPKALRFGAAADRVALRAAEEVSSLRRAEEAARAAAGTAGSEARALRSTEYVGSDYYNTVRRQTDPLMDTWESSTYRRGAGETVSAADRAAEAAKRSGRSVSSKTGYDLGSTSVSYSLKPTRDELWRADQLDKVWSGSLESAAKLGSRAAKAEAKSTTSQAIIKEEIARRVAALKRLRKNPPAPVTPKRPTGLEGL